MEKYQLSNGAQVVLAPFSGTEAAAILVLFKVGSRNEPSSVWGGSHFVEHLMFKGTERRPETIDISKELDRFGAEYNAYTGKDLTGYWVKIAGSKLEVAVDLIGDMLFHSKFDAVEMEREKKVIIEEIKMYEENPMMHVEDLLEEAMFDGHILGKNIAGTPESMTKMDRDEVIAYHKSHYHPGNMIVVASGNLPSDIKNLIETTFGSVTLPDDKSDLAIDSGNELDQVIARGRVRVQYKDNKQIQIMFGFPTFGRNHQDEAAIKILASILGGTMSSRLFVEVREKRGLCYSVRSSWDAYEEVGMLTIKSGLDAERLDEAAKVIFAELKKLVDQGVTAEELKMAKDNVRGGLALRLEDSSERAEFFGRQALFYGKVELPEERLKRFEAVTLEDIKRVAGEIIDFNRISVAAVGPYKDAEELRLRIENKN